MYDHLIKRFCLFLQRVRTLHIQGIKQLYFIWKHAMYLSKTQISILKLNKAVIFGSALSQIDKFSPRRCWREGCRSGVYLLLRTQCCRTDLLSGLGQRVEDHAENYGGCQEDHAQQDGGQQHEVDIAAASLALNCVAHRAVGHSALWTVIWQITGLVSMLQPNGGTMFSHQSRFSGVKVTFKLFEDCHCPIIEVMLIWFVTKLFYRYVDWYWE